MTETADPRPAGDDLDTEAERIIAGETYDLDDAIGIAVALRNRNGFRVARRVLERLWNEHEGLGRDAERFRKVRQLLALCTYRDPDLDPECKLDDAFAILETCEDLSTTTDQESLGLAGAIWKRKWEQDAALAHLERSLAYYQRGHDEGMKAQAALSVKQPGPAGPPGLFDHYDGYTGINAALVLDLIAYQEMQAAGGAPHDFAEARVRKAREIRTDIATRLEALNDEYTEQFGRTWWLIVTVAEAHFGLQDFRAAHEWLRKAKARIKEPMDDENPIAEWEQETTARQLANLAMLQSPPAARGEIDLRQPAWQALAELVPNPQALRGIVIGKIGLALSGGGFRASLFHVGVLARFAELDVLRHVDSLSCVSGGSIIGAYYYLKLQRLIESTPDERITQADYVKLVKEIECEFLAGVQRNVRMRIFSDWWANVKMLFKPGYSPTMRLGELYERELYQRVFANDAGPQPGAAAAGAQEPPYWINDLILRPQGEPQDFSPKAGNWRRGAKVPILILNATSLNTGHNWQFTATYMGESPTAISRTIDCNYRLRRIYYRDAPDGWKRVRLGHAVAASSCVPGLFQPLVLDRLYVKPAALDDAEPRQDRPVSVRLVDGGVYDNQGSAALIEQGCNVLLVSDASGQSESEDAPPLSLLGVPLRTMGLLQQRVRIAQYHELAARRRASLLRELMFIHLKKDLDGAAIDWIECQDPVPPPPLHPVTSYGISKEVQRRLSAIRTDLDSFTDLEAGALMASGYHMADKACPQVLRAGAARQGGAGAGNPVWTFMDPDFEPHLGAPSPVQVEIRRQLDAAAGLAFKIWKLSRRLRVLSRVLGIVLLLASIWLATRYWDTDVGAAVGRLTSAAGLTVGMIVGVVAVAAAGWYVNPWVNRVLNYRKALYQTLLLVGLALGGSLVAKLHLRVFDRWFLHHGSLERLKRKFARR